MQKSLNALFVATFMSLPVFAGNFIIQAVESLVTLPPEATRQAILQGDSKAIDAAWSALNLGDTAWWREWKRQW